MGSADEYRKRAQWCSDRAQTVANGIDRARWLQLPSNGQPSAACHSKGAGTSQRPDGILAGSRATCFIIAANRKGPASTGGCRRGSGSDCGCLTAREARRYPIRGASERRPALLMCQAGVSLPASLCRFSIFPAALLPSCVLDRRTKQDRPPHRPRGRTRFTRNAISAALFKSRMSASRSRNALRHGSMLPVSTVLMARPPSRHRPGYERQHADIWLGQHSRTRYETAAGQCRHGFSFRGLWVNPHAKARSRTDCAMC